jgi:preprotein translocase SecE subunit
MNTNTNRLVVIFWIGASLCIGIFFEKVIGDLLAGPLHLGDPVIFFDYRTSQIAGYALAVAVGIGTFLQPRLRLLAFESATEIKKVTWPSRQDTQRQTLAVLGFSMVVASILGFFDSAGAKIMTGWLPHLFSRIAAGLGH